MNRIASFLIGAGVLGGVAYVCWREFATVDAVPPLAPAVAIDAPTPPSAPTPPEVDATPLGQRVHGIVRLPDGRPASGARVLLLRMLSAWPEWRAEPLAGEEQVTGADGAFRFRTERQPQLLVQFEHPQYAGDLVEAPQPVERLELRLRLGDTIEGRVVSPRNQPLAGVRVALESTQADDRRVQAAVLTESDGSYRFVNVAIGAVRIVARSDSWQPAVLPWAMVGAGRVRDLRFEQQALVVGGRVVESATETPVVGAEVLALAAGQQLGRNDPAIARTDGSGQFQLAGLGRGNLRLEVRHPKYATSVRTVVVGQQSSELAFELLPRSGVAGRLIAPDGLAVGGARLLLRSAADELGQATVGDDGAFRFDGRFTHGWATLAVAGGRFAFGETGAAALQLRIEEGADAKVERAVTAPAVLAGSVLDDRGQPLVNARLSVVQTDLVRDRLLQAGAALWERNLQKIADPFSRTAGGEAERLLAMTDADGAFRIAGMLPGPLSLRVQHPSHGTRQVSFEVPAAGALSNGQKVSMPIGGSITGRVQRGGLPLPGVQVDVKAEGSAITAVTDLKGRYELTDLPPGSYRVRARFASLTATAQSSEVEPGKPSVVDLEFQSARVIGGTVVDTNRQPVEGAVVMVKGEDGNRVTTDAEGRFQIEAESQSRVVELQVVYGDRAAPTQKRVIGSSDVTITISLPPLCTVRATIYGLPGRKKLGGVLVRATPREGTAAAEVPRSQWVELQGGTLRQPLLTEGRWRLQLWSEGYAPFEQDVDARPGDDLQLGEVLLEPGCEVRGRLVDAAGRPIAGAEVFVGEEEDLGRFQLRQRSDADGAFVVGGVSTAASDLVVRARGFAVQTVRLRLPHDALAKTPLQVALDPGATVRVAAGAITDNMLLLTRGNRVLDTREIDDQGVAVFEHVPPGDYVVQTPSATDAQVRVTVAKGATVVEVRLR